MEFFIFTHCKSIAAGVLPKVSGESLSREILSGRNEADALPEKGYRFLFALARARASAKAGKTLIFWPQQLHRRLDVDYFTGRLYINENSDS